jgi:hypothetical protein
MKNININPVFIATTAGTSIIKNTILREHNPFSNLFMGVTTGFLFNHSKNKRHQDFGKGLIAGSIMGFTVKMYNQNKCVYSYDNITPRRNSILVNKNTGIVLKSNGKPIWIYVTSSNNPIEGWRGSALLYHCIRNLEGKGGGRPSNQGEPVIWNHLQDHTEKFNQVLKHWTEYFSIIKPLYSHNYEEKINFWRSMVDDYKPLDIKRKSFHPSAVSEWSIYNNTLVRYDDYGNILYGAAGTAFGLNETELLLGANLNQIFKGGLDESKDTYSIQRGINMYKKYQNQKKIKNLRTI